MSAAGDQHTQPPKGKTHPSYIEQIDKSSSGLARPFKGNLFQDRLPHLGICLVVAAIRGWKKGM
jgi:hypothetical protein